MGAVFDLVDSRMSLRPRFRQSKELVHQGNIRRITIKNEAGDELLEIPLTVGVVGAVLLPVWVAVGAIAALAANYTLKIERVDRKA